MTSTKQMCYGIFFSKFGVFYLKKSAFTEQKRYFLEKVIMGPSFSKSVLNAKWIPLLDVCATDLQCIFYTFEILFETPMTPRQEMFFSVNINRFPANSVSIL
jgi:hypothetical protein